MSQRFVRPTLTTIASPGATTSGAPPNRIEWMSKFASKHKDQYGHALYVAGTLAHRHDVTSIDSLRRRVTLPASDVDKLHAVQLYLYRNHYTHALDVLSHEVDKRPLSQEQLDILEADTKDKS